jgi:hypothetical protein
VYLKKVCMYLPCWETSNIIFGLPRYFRRVCGNKSRRADYRKSMQCWYCVLLNILNIKCLTQADLSYGFANSWGWPWLPTIVKYKWLERTVYLEWSILSITENWCQIFTDMYSNL